MNGIQISNSCSIADASSRKAALGIGFGLLDVDASPEDRKAAKSCGSEDEKIKQNLFIRALRIPSVGERSDRSIVDHLSRNAALGAYFLFGSDLPRVDTRPSSSMRCGLEDDK